VRGLVLQGIQKRLKETSEVPPRKFELPLIRSSRPGTLDLTNEQIDDILFLP